MTIYFISSHAVLRYIERKEGIDVDARWQASGGKEILPAENLIEGLEREFGHPPGHYRALIQAMIPRSDEPLCSVECYEGTLCFQGTTVTTFLAPDMKNKYRRRYTRNPRYVV